MSSSRDIIFFTRATRGISQTENVENGCGRDKRGREEVPVISCGGGIAALLYGILIWDGDEMELIESTRVENNLRILCVLDSCDDNSPKA